jgi:tRNA-specific 2-thiouridylase
LKKAEALGADYIATGHYAKISYNPKSQRFSLKQGLDVQKDQSYCLYMMTQAQLGKTLMPLGEFTKERTRKVAKEKGLAVADKPDSQEICFIPSNRYSEFLKEYIPEAIAPGPILNQDGEVIGEHKGIVFYTIGQRRWIGVPDKTPFYVIKIDAARNAIIVGKKECGFSDELTAENVNFITMEKLERPMRIEAKIRYLHTRAWATISPLDQEGKVKVKFDKPQWAVTPGQAVVFYRSDTVVGGGTIRNGKNGNGEDE